MIRANLLSSLMMAAGLLTYCLSATAQTEAVGTPEADAAEGAGPASAGVSTVGLQEVVITAEKRSKPLSKTPLAVSVVTSDDLKASGTTSAKGLTDMMANVQIGQGSLGATDISIRGIGSTDPSERGDPSAAFHIDGVYLGRSQSAGATFFDVERVEVLRGPQGTLYGRNANAGAVNVITKKPSGIFEGAANFELGNHETRVAEGMVNVPVNDMLALRAVVSRTYNGGYTDSAHAPENRFTKDRDDADNTSGRLHGLLRLSNETSWLVTVDGSRDRGAGPHPFVITNNQIDHPDWRVSPVNQGHIHNHGAGVSSEFKTSLGFADMVYLYGHRTNSRNEETSNGDASTIGTTAFQLSNQYKQDSHELRLSSKGAGPLQWLAGLYSFKETGENIDLSVFVNLPPQAGGLVPIVRFVQNPAISESTAAFGQATYSLRQDLRVTGGLRFTHDEKSRQGVTYDGTGAMVGNVGNQAAGTWNKVTWKLGVDYDLNKAALLYANLATGFKAGGFNDGNAVVGDPNYNSRLYYNPETITSFEVGSKTRHLDGKLQLNVAGFIYDYEDLQLQSVVNNSLNTTNAGKARVLGLEAEGKYAITPSDRLTFAAGWLKARYKQYVTPDGQDYSGRALDKAPDMTFSLNYTHSWELSSGALVSATAGTRYSSDYVLSDPGALDRVTGTPIAAKQVTQDSFWRSDVSLAYSSPDDKWKVQAYVKNIENKRQLAGMVSDSGHNWGYLTSPRSLGVRVGVKF